ncbi:GDP-mannose-dependent alpha-(1-6)-phosphatidylinositol monomannoside mannosyltransferase [bacterium BMS3Bbin06]|nr:GDP-mannose-dependent alpha-(1-6)-phosphatidylinositol monomannoside mannosyltransferase [bacterium BMS3Abin08]GBE34847.1 GDP-mannose-dependent alpha-(1-6)-phosphatidylinositol monomannoside mannosyltransferase [bacterium BMS3Bbin06]HDO35807.1 glycosyltransferase family 1 protein [Nitrospirota bacterium]HDY70872.1 glycosyltransferase family 1 protein [Nitrospirota bacterium]
MKIALYNLTTTTKRGGIETFNWEMAGALARRGHSVCIYGGKGHITGDVPEGVSIKTYPYLKRTLVPDLGSRFRKFVERISFGILAFANLSKEGFDYIYVSKPYDIPLTLISSRLSSAKLIYGSGGTEFFPGYGFLAGKVDFLFACSGFNASQIEEYCGLRPKVLYNGVNTEIFSPRPPDMELKRGIGIKNDEAVIISACRLVGWKGIQYSVKAVSSLVRKGYRIKYLVIGEGDYRKELESLSKALNTEGRIIFPGSIKNSELPSYYSIADLAVFPSIADETFGISIAEAMACGVPVISTRTGGIPEVVGKGAGVLVPPADEVALTETTEKLLRDKGLRESLGRRGREWVVENFRWDRIAEVFEHHIAEGNGET